MITRAATVADLEASVTRCRAAAFRMSRDEYRANAADLHAWADEAQRNLDDITPAPWTLRARLEVAASVVFADAVLSVVLWAAVLR